MGARLVRDYMAQVPWKCEELKRCLRPVHDATEHETLLRMKLGEEVAEFLAARSREEMIEEMADIFEVLDTFMNRHQIYGSEVDARQAEKYQERGGFLTGMVLET